MKGWLRKASPAPSERRGVLLGRWLGKVGRSITRYCLFSWNSRTANKGVLFLKRRGRFFEAKRGFLHSKETPSLMGMKASPPTPLRMERGVDSAISHRTNNSYTRQLSTCLLVNYQLVYLNKQITTTKRGSSSYPNLPPLGYIPSFGGAWGGLN